jgi:hypothetical protein
MVSARVANVAVFACIASALYVLVSTASPRLTSTYCSVMACIAVMLPAV